MAEEEDFSSLPLADRWVHKVWKVRKQAYEDAVKAFEVTPDEFDPAFRPFNQDPGLLKSAAADSNIAAQQEGLAALCAYLKFGGKDGLRSRSVAISPICEKCLSSTRAATKASALEALMLYVELDVPGPVIEEILPSLSAKQPKVVAASLAALTQIFHNFGCKLADPKPVLKVLPKMFSHADKNVRAEATSLAVEFYRWLRDAMKPMFWNELKPTQQTDLEAQFEKVKAEGTPKQERLLRSQKAAMERAPQGGDVEDEFDGGDDGEEPGEIDAFDLAEPQDVLSKVPKDFFDNINSSKWKDRKDAAEALYAVLNVPRIKDGDFNEIARMLAKSMKDANIAVVTQAAQCIEVMAKGLRQAFGKHRTTVMQPIMERMKEKKQSVADALGAALDQVFQATSLSECLEDIQAFLVHKNPQVKEGTMRFLVRCLRTTRTVPAKPEVTQIVESGKKLLSESSEVLRSGGAEILGTIMKIIGERAMNPHLEGLDDIRKTKIKEFFDAAEVKAKDKPKPPPPAPAARGGPPKKVLKGGVKKAPAARDTPVDSSALAPQPTSRAAPGSKLGMAKPSGVGAPKGLQKRVAAPTSPKRAPPPAEEDEWPASPPPAKPVSRLGMGRGGLAGRSLAKPAAAAPPEMPPSPPVSSGLAAMERAELEELRGANERLLRQLDEGRHDRSKLMSEIQELKNQNAGLIEDHTRDVLSIKAKETQLVRARSDAEAAESTNERLRRELDRLKRALSKAESMVGQHHHDLTSPGPGSPSMDAMLHQAADEGIYRDRPASASRHRGNRMSYTSTFSNEEKENGGDAGAYRQKLSPDLRYNGSGSANSGRGSPARPVRRDLSGGGGGDYDDPRMGGDVPAYVSRTDSVGSRTSGGGRIGSRTGGPPPSSNSGNQSGGSGAPANSTESWKRAAEVTSQLKARIEQMKVTSLHCAQQDRGSGQQHLRRIQAKQNLSRS